MSQIPNRTGLEVSIHYNGVKVPVEDLLNRLRVAEETLKCTEEALLDMTRRRNSVAARLESYERASDETRMAAALKEVEELKVKLADAKEEMTKVNKDRLDLVIERDTLKYETRRLQGKLKDQAEEMGRLSNERNLLAADRDRLNAAFDSLHQEQVKTIANLNTLVAENQQLTKKLEATRHSLNLATKDRNSAIVKMNAARDAAKQPPDCEAMTYMDSVMADVQELKKTVASLSTRIASLAGAVDSVENRTRVFKTAPLPKASIPAVMTTPIIRSDSVPKVVNLNAGPPPADLKIDAPRDRFAVALEKLACGCSICKSIVG